MAAKIENKVIANWEHEILEALIESNNVNLSVFSENGKLLYANHTMKKLLGYDNPAEKLLNPDFSKICNLPVKNNHLVFEGYLTIGDYAEINISLRALIYRKNHEILILALENQTDLQEQNKNLHQLNREINNLQRQLIREKRNLEEAFAQLDESNRKLKRANRQKDKFFSIIAHDLRSPFNSILGFTEILKDNYHDLTEEQIKKYINHLYDSTYNTYNLLVNLLEWSSLQREATRFQPEKILFSELFNEVITIINEQAFQKNITVKKHLNEGLHWEADRNMLKSILRNLLTNAIKFSRTDGEITLSAQKTNNNLEIAVTDNGIGMAKEFAGKLFKNEFNDSKKGTANEKGSGLGLSLCKEFIELHGGKIWVNSELNKGTQIKFTLPPHPSKK